MYGLFFWGAALLLAQTAEHDRTIRLVHTESAQNIQELATVIRSMTDIRQLSSDQSQKLISLRGTTDQLALAEWVAGRLDIAAGARPEPGKHEYRLPPGEDNAVGVFYFANARTPQALQEAATLLRSIVQVRRLFTYPGRAAMIVRGSESQIAMSEWIVARLDVAAPPSGPQEYRAAGDDVLRVFYLANANEVRKLQEIATLIRVTAEIRQMFTYNPLQAIALRGSRTQIAMAEWLVGRMDRSSAPSAGPHVYRVPGSADDMVRVFYLADGMTPQRVQEIAREMRTTAEIRTLFTYNTLRAIAARGTAGQMAVAEQVAAAR